MRRKRNLDINSEKLNKIEIKQILNHGVFLSKN